MTNQLALNLALPIGSLDAYIQAVNRVPMLTADEERNLARRLRDHGDLEAARQLVLSHLRFVVRVARGYNGYGLGQADLIQEGNIGLMKAVKRFDPELGVRLVSFAVHWVRAEMHEFILRNWRIVKVATTKAQRKLFFNLRSAKKRLGWMNGEEVADVARELGVSTRDVMEMEQRMSGHDASFDPAPEQDADSRALVPAAHLEDDSAGPEMQLESEQDEALTESRLRLALATLDERSRAIIEHRWLREDRVTLHDLADRFGVSAERVRQLENNAMKRMRAALAA